MAGSSRYMISLIAQQEDLPRYSFSRAEFSDIDLQPPLAPQSNVRICAGIIERGRLADTCCTPCSGGMALLVLSYPLGGISIFVSSKTPCSVEHVFLSINLYSCSLGAAGPLKVNLILQRGRISDIKEDHS